MKNLPPKIQFVLSLLTALVCLSGCHYTRHVPEGKALLWQQHVELTGREKAGYEAQSILKQEPNRDVLGWRPSLMLYSWGPGHDSSLLGRLGNPPVFLDEARAQQSLTQLENYYFNRGYFQVESQYQIEQKEKKAAVRYQLQLGPRYTIDTLVYQVDDPYIAGLFKGYQQGSLIREGAPYQAPVLDKERQRLSALLRNHGYYDFSPSYITYLADTVSPVLPRRVKLVLRVQKRQLRQGDSLVRRPHQRYRLARVVLRPDYNYVNPTTPRDTIEHRGYHLAFDTLRYRPRYLTDALHLVPGSFYRQKKLEETYAHLASYQAFSITEITFQPLGSTADTALLEAQVRLEPRPKYSLNPSLEATNTSSNLGINGNLSLTARNVFRGGEALKLDLSSGLQYQPTVGNQANLSRTFELRAELGLDIPRFLLPFNTEGLVPKRMLPQSEVKLFASRTNRIEFDRETFGGRLDYRWQQDALKQHRLSVLNTSFSNLLSIQEGFVEELSPIQQLAFSSEFVTSTTWDFTYNGQPIADGGAYHYFNSNLELGGNLQALVHDSWANPNSSDQSLDQLFSVPIYQFARLKADYRYYWPIDGEHLWIQRLTGGFVRPYGNSRLDRPGGDLLLPPFSRFFFLGGSNDLRAWPAYRAGGGNAQITSYTQNPGDSSGFATGTFKLLANSEYRFPIYSYLKGALFLDAGNIWLTGGLENDQPATAFSVSDLLGDLYLGTGFGLRLDLDYFVIRFDTGLKLRDPGYRAQDQDWVIATQPILPNLVFNIALGYPF
ncbi:MAG: BamA/TamA family outer membrane protein [Schleiferiaceae bacterium]|nr:BamA/TamA family outer membrane protein [Schleiferiaceae bacterium]